VQQELGDECGSCFVGGGESVGSECFRSIKLAGYKVGRIPGDRSKLKEGAGDTISPELDGRKITAH
jgi:hypothetical protein